MSSAPIRLPHQLVGAALMFATLAATTGAQTLRWGFTGPLDTLDPQRATSMFAQQYAGTLFDQLLTYDYLARPVKMVPLAATALPDVSTDGRDYTFRIRPGILFAPHPAFHGKPRELVAEDFAYSLKRLADPALASPVWGLYQGAIEGLDALAAAATAAKRRFDYDVPVSGIVVVDRYTLRIRLARVDRSFVYLFASPGLSALPREVIEAEGDGFGLRPVGSGPYVVREYQPNARLVLERNPAYRTLKIRDVAPGPASDAALAAAISELPYPASSRVELTFVPEPTTARLAVERGELDVVRIARPDVVFKGTAADPALTKSSVRLVRGSEGSSDFLVFGMRDPVIGGAGREATALRRAIAMAFDDREYIQIIEGGIGELRSQPVPPGIAGHLAGYRSRNAFDRASANALLDRTGFARGPDGRRRLPSGGELKLTMIVGTSSTSRQFSEFMRRTLDAIGVRVEFDAMPGGERMKRILACRFQLITMDWGLDTPDGSNIMLAFYSKAAGNVGLSCVEDAQFDADYRRLLAAPLGEQRDPVYAALRDRLDVLMPARAIPTSDAIFAARANVRGLAVHPALYALFPYVSVSAAPP